MTRVDQRTPTGKSWQAMMTRCFNKNSGSYAAYGGRGITVCDFIKSSFKAIIGLIGERPFGKSLDRIDNEGNYSCGSCEQCDKWGWKLNIQWSSRSRQQRNRRTTRYLTINGIKKSLPDWADETGISQDLIRNRLKEGWSGGKLLHPIIDPSRSVTINGKTMNIKAWSKEVGIRESAFRQRLEKGWTEEQLLLKKQRPRQVYKFYANNRIYDSERGTKN